MMSPDASFPAEFVSYDYNHDDIAITALFGLPSTGMDEFFFPESTLPVVNHLDFLDLTASPGTLSSLSVPSSPFSLADDLSELGGDVPTSYSPNLSPTAPSVLTPLVEVKPAKTDLDGFEYHSATRKWVCVKCGGDFVSTHEARRHVKTAAKCTGKKVKCLRCGDHIHASQWSRKRHFTSKKCQRKGRKRGTPAYTVNNAYVESDSDSEL